MLSYSEPAAAMHLESQKPSGVLIVEDDGAVLAGLKEAFEHAGRRVVACDTFEAARTKLTSEQFCTLITDVRLGPFNGLQLALIARHLYQGMDIVVMTGFNDSVLRDEAARLGAAYVVKPVTATQLLDLTAGRSNRGTTGR